MFKFGNKQSAEDAKKQARIEYLITNWDTISPADKDSLYRLCGVQNPNVHNGGDPVDAIRKALYR